MFSRPRRLRKTPGIRRLVSENRLSADDFVVPCFLTEGTGLKVPIESMPGIFRYSADKILRECEELLKLDIGAIAPFPMIPEEKKDSRGTESKNPQGLMPFAIRRIKEQFPELLIFADVAMDPYSSDGHDGVVKDGEILNDETLPILADMAICLADAGADFVAPSDMMDGRIRYIRNALDQAGFSETGILSYSAKYASSFYSPFRDALDSTPKKGDKKTYQMNPANRSEASREAKADIAEGADILMVKPGICYLDVLSDLKKNTDLPVAVYNVSGEYAMLQAATKNGWLNYENCVTEILISFKRAGADLIFSYHAKEMMNQFQHRPFL